MYSEVIRVGVDYGGRTDAFVSVCLSTCIHVPKYGLSLQCGCVKSAEYWIAAHPLRMLLKLGIVSCYTVLSTCLHGAKNVNSESFRSQVYTRIATMYMFFKKGTRGNSLWFHLCHCAAYFQTLTLACGITWPNQFA